MNKQIRGFAYFDKHYAVLMLKHICLETRILFYASLIIGCSGNSIKMQH